MLGVLPFENDSFDTVSFVACLIHIPNREEALREAWRVLKPNGLLLATMISPLISQFWHRLIGKDDPDQHERGQLELGEVWGITSQDMARLISTAGFQMVNRKRFIFGLNNLYMARKE